MQAIHSEYQLRAPFLVLVEGKSDEVMLKSAMAQWFPALSAVQILPYHSKDKLGSMLKILCNQPEFKQVNRLAIFRDADDNATSAFQSVQQHLRNNPTRISSDVVPEQMQVVQHTARLSIGIFVMPNCCQPGALENVLLASLDENLGACINRYVSDASQYLEGTAARRYCNSVKSQTYAYTALFETENFRDSFRKGVWDWEHLAFAPIKHFLQQFDLPAVE